jgi:hypothetical protein
MGRLKETLLTEKVSKREIELALNNPNIMVGAEFEFVVPEFLVTHKEEVEKQETLDQFNMEGDDYEQAMESWEEEGDDNIPLPRPPDWATKLGYEPGDDLPDPEEEFPDLEIDKYRTFNALIAEFIPINKLPFTNPIISSDNETKSSTRWVIKPDGSLGLAGVEIVSPIMPLPEFVRVCPKMFDYITKYGEINDDCGFHIGMSIKGVKNLGQSLDIVKLSLFTDEDYIYKYFDMRKYNQYAKSAQGEIRASNIGKDKMIRKFIETKKVETEYSDEHYMAINVEHLNTKNEYIEFRYIGGKDYHRKWDRVKNVVAQYAFNLSLACDPEYKKKEYILKLHNLMLKAELFSCIVQINELKGTTSKENKERLKDLIAYGALLSDRVELTDDDIIHFSRDVDIDLDDINDIIEKYLY